MYLNKEGFAYHCFWRIGTSNRKLVRVIEGILERVEDGSALCGSDNGALDRWDFWLNGLSESTVLVELNLLIKL
jgi:hypothetical protein